MLVLVDNSVVLYSMRKSRSSSNKLLILLRRMCAYLLSMNVYLHLVYVPSAINPADDASRGRGGTEVESELGSELVNSSSGYYYDNEKKKNEH